MTPIEVQVIWSKIKVKLLVLILSAFYSISYDPLISMDIKKVNLLDKVKLTNPNH